MKIALVIQRFGENIVGGAEFHAKVLAEKIQADLRHSVHIYTTHATDYETWQPSLPITKEHNKGLYIYRFPTFMPRFPFIFKAYKALFASLRPIRKISFFKKLTQTLESLWFILQGPFTPSLIKALQERHDQYDAIIFFTYLYYPTLKGLQTIPGRKFLIPTAHDEPPFYFDTVKNSMLAAEQILANTKPEKDLICSILPEDHHQKVSVLGFGITVPSEPIPQKRKTHFLYLGRIGKAKGVVELMANFLDFIKTLDQTVDQPILVLAGKLEHDVVIPDSPHIRYLGFIDEERKKQLLMTARGLINPSRYESLSLIVLEALAAGTPAIVNRHCPVLAWYATECPSVFSYKSRLELHRSLQACLDYDFQDSKNLHNLEKSRDWIRRHYSWDVVLEKLTKALSSPTHAGVDHKA